MKQRNESIEEAVLREYYGTITLPKADLWSQIRSRIAAETQEQPRKFSRRLAVAVLCGALVIAFLLGMVSHRFFVYRSEGNRIELSENGVYTDESGMNYHALEGRFEQSGVTYGYDWKDYISVDEDNSAFRYVTEDYEAFCASAEGNCLGVRLPKRSAIPEEYSQRPYFAATYYLTPEDRAKERETGALPQELSKQIGRYEIKWFKETKEHFTFSCMPYEEIESALSMFVVTDDSNASYRPVEIEGFEKAFVVTVFNPAFEEYETDLHLYEKIEPIQIAADEEFPVLSGEGDTLTANYMSYLVQTCGLSEEEVIAAVRNAFS